MRNKSSYVAMVNKYFDSTDPWKVNKDNWSADIVKISKNSIPTTTQDTLAEVIKIF